MGVSRRGELCLFVVMNIFRLLGDMSHLAAIVLLIVKLHISRSAAGEDRNIVCRNLVGEILKNLDILASSIHNNGRRLCVVCF